jgi:hypothetical protein
MYETSSWFGKKSWQNFTSKSWGGALTFFIFPNKVSMCEQKKLNSDQTGDQTQKPLNESRVSYPELPGSLRMWMRSQ